MGECVELDPPETDASDEVQRLLASLLPSSIACIARDPSSGLADLHPAEEPYVRGAVAKRRLEFAAGRACARAALERFGVRDAVLPSCADRTPLWTAGFVGSITHCAGAVAAAVARRSEVESVGVDIEESSALPESLHPLVASERERERLARIASCAPADGFKLLFSAKESFFKCHFMVARRMLEFHDVEIDLDLQRGRFTGTLVDANARATTSLHRLLGRFCVSRRHVFTAVVLPARGAVR